MLDEAMDDWADSQKQTLVNWEKFKTQGALFVDLKGGVKSNALAEIPMVQLYLQELFCLTEEMLEDFRENGSQSPF